MNQNLHLPPIINGLWQIADLERRGDLLPMDTLDQEISRYVDQGFGAFDMADHYGSAEVIMGHYQKSHPDHKLDLLTKWVPKPGKLDSGEIREAVQLSLDCLQTKQLDLLQYHAWNYADPAWLDQLFLLSDLREEGLIKNLGLTNMDAVHLQMAIESGIPISTNQISFSLLDRRAQKKMIEVCTQYDVKILAFGTLAGGFLTEKWLNKPEPELTALRTWSQMKYKRYIDQVGGWKIYQEVLSKLAQLAKKNSMSLANLATGYILHQPGVSSVIIGCRLGESQHIDDNKKLLSIQFPPHLLQEVEAIIDVLDPIKGNCGDEYRKPPFLTASGDLSDHLDALPAPHEVIELHGSRKVIYTGTLWEKMAGYARAIKRNNSIHVSGTTATHQERVIGGQNPYAQTHFILDKIEGVLQSFGASLWDIVRTRIYIKKTDYWEPVARAHGERFQGIDPANTLVQADLIGDEYLVEIEVEAELEQ